MLFDLTGHATKHDRLKRALSFIRFGSYYAVLASVIERKKKKKIKVLHYFCRCGATSIIGPLIGTHVQVIK